MHLFKSAALISAVAAFRIANEEEIKFNCVGLPDGVNFNNPKDCSQFFECTNGIAKVFDCADEEEDVKLQFNNETRTCDWASNVKCDAATAEKGWENCYGLEDDVKYAAIDANYYFTCVGGEKQANTSCGVGYVFDIGQRACVLNDTNATTWETLQSTGKTVNAFQAQYAQRFGGKLSFKGDADYEEFYAHNEATLNAAAEGNLSALKGAADAGAGAGAGAGAPVESPPAGGASADIPWKFTKGLGQTATQHSFSSDGLTVTRTSTSDWDVIAYIVDKDGHALSKTEKQEIKLHYNLNGTTKNVWTVGVAWNDNLKSSRDEPFGAATFWLVDAGRIKLTNIGGTGYVEESSMLGMMNYSNVYDIKLTWDPAVKEVCLFTILADVETQYSCIAVPEANWGDDFYFTTTVAHTNASFEITA